MWAGLGELSMFIKQKIKDTQIVIYLSPNHNYI